MPDTIKTGTILIKQGTLLPADLPVENEACAPGWRFVKGFDSFGLERKINEANWNFFYLAGEITATAMGREGQKTVRRAVKRIVAKLTGQKFNSLEITRVASRHVLGLPYVSVTAHSRHIQEGVFLVPVKDFRVWNTAQLPAVPELPMRLGRGEPQHQGKVITERHVAMISSV